MLRVPILLTVAATARPNSFFDCSAAHLLDVPCSLRRVVLRAPPCATDLCVDRSIQIPAVTPPASGTNLTCMLRSSPSFFPASVLPFTAPDVYFARLTLDRCSAMNYCVVQWFNGAPPPPMGTPSRPSGYLHFSRMTSPFGYNTSTHRPPTTSTHLHAQPPPPLTAVCLLLSPRSPARVAAAVHATTLHLPPLTPQMASAEEIAIKAALAAGARDLGAANKELTSVSNDALLKMSQRIGVYLARTEVAGPFVYNELEQLVSRLSANMVDGEGQTASAVITFLPNLSKTHATVALLETYSQPLANELIISAPSRNLLACYVDDAAQVPKIASAVSGFSVLHAPIPEGDFDYLDKDAVARHATGWLVHLNMCMTAIKQNNIYGGLPFEANSFKLVSASVTPRTPGSVLFTTLTLVIAITAGALKGPVAPHTCTPAYTRSYTPTLLLLALPPSPCAAMHRMMRVSDRLHHQQALCLHHRAAQVQALADFCHGCAAHVQVRGGVQAALRLARRLLHRVPSLLSRVPTRWPHHPQVPQRPAPWPGPSVAALVWPRLEQHAASPPLGRPRPWPLLRQWQAPPWQISQMLVWLLGIPCALVSLAYVWRCAWLCGVRWTPTATFPAWPMLAGGCLECCRLRLPSARQPSRLPWSRRMHACAQSRRFERERERESTEPPPRLLCTRT